MIQPIVLLIALAGLVLTLLAALLEGTGVNGSVGAWLAVTGAAATLIGLALLAGARMGRGLHWVLAVLTVLAAGLTAVAGWFLMQNVLAVVMAAACLGSLILAIRISQRRRTFA
jgi:quinoprotein glucose dehydrogenase